MKILITGKNSRIGQAFIEYMSNNHPSEMTVETVSLRDDAWRGQDWSGYDAVLHLAGISEGKNPDTSEKAKQKYFEINKDLSTAVAKKARSSNVGYFIYASTMMVYGQSAPIGRSFTIDRNTVPKPESYYGMSKYEGECNVMALADSGFCVAVVREPVVYGKHFNGEFQKLLMLSKRIPFFPVIESCKSYIFEDNLSECFRRLILEKRSGIFCPQNSETPTTSDLYRIMRSALSKRTIGIKGLKPLLKLLSYVTRYVNAVFNDMKYTPELSRIEGIDYCICSLEESVKRCLN